MAGESTRLLQRNRDEEELEEGKTSLYTYSKKTLNPKAHDGKMLKYDAAGVSGWAALTQYSGTAMARGALWRTCAVYWLITIVLAVAVFISRLMQTSLTKSLKIDSDKNMLHLSTVTTYVTALLGFMIGFFVTQSISRWWAVRDKGVGALWQAISSMQLFLAVRLTTPEDRYMKDTVLRLCLLCNRLMFAEAQRRESDEDLDNLIKVGLLTKEEKLHLLGQPAKAQCVVVWLGRFLHTVIMGQGRVNNKEIRALDLHCAQMRHAIGETFAFLNTQLPFQYVHLLATSLLISNTLIAVKCGVAIGKNLSPDTPTDYVYCMVQVFHVFFVPFSYHAFVLLCEELSNPLGEDFGDLPGYAFHCLMRDESQAVHHAGEDTPPGLLAKAEGVVPPPRKSVVDGT